MFAQEDTQTSSKPQILGCTNPQATNYNNQATEDDWSCVIPPPPPPKILWCTNPNALNYNPQATEENGTCQEKIEGCTDSTATNYNPRANIHVENMCQYAPEWPSEITGFFENSPTVQIWATTWTIKIKTNVENTFLDISKVQTWEHFRVTEYTTEWKDIIITMKQFDDQRLELEECTNYEITIPRDAITAQVQKRTGTEIIKNHNAITGNFTVTGCQNSSNNPQDPNSQNPESENKSKHENTIKENNFYLSLYDTDEKWKVYINLVNLAYILGFATIFIFIFIVFIQFIKNSFLWKSRK